MMLKQASGVLRRLICRAMVFSLLVVGCSAIAAADQSPVVLAATDLQQPGLRALKHFNELPPHLTPAPTRTRPKRDFQDTCSVLTQDCVNYIAKHRDRVLREELPSNPAYWQAFWAFLESPPIEHYARLDWQLPREHSYHLQRVVQALQSWPLYELARAGVLSPQHAMLAAHESRRRLLQSANGYERMVWVAAAQPSQAALGLAMAQALSDGQHDDLTRLFGASRPYSPAELSLRAMVASEIALAYEGIPDNLPKRWDDYPAWIRARYSELPATLEQLDQAAVEQEWTEQLFADAVAHFKAVVAAMPVVVDMAAMASERSIADFMASGNQLPVEEALSSLQGKALELAKSPLPIYLEYARNQYYLIINSHVEQALADMYAGRIAVGTPAQPAPASFSWDWRASQQTLCLVPDSDAQPISVSFCRPHFAEWSDD